MNVSVYIPTPYRRHTEGRAGVEAVGKTVGGVLEDLAARFPGLGAEIFEQGRLARHVAVYLNDEEIGALGGLEAAVADGDEVALIPAMAGGALLTDDQMDRYSRQLLLPEVGVSGQRRLLGKKVLVIGAGGLGAPAAIYLAAAGVGTVGIVDADRVERSNLHRQPLHSERTIGLAKTASARRMLEDLNPDVHVAVHETLLTSENAFEILRPYDVIVNGSDNFPTRYLVSDACVMLEKPLVDAAILRFEGQATVFLPGHGCYRCLYPEPPQPGSVPSCSEAGVLGALAGQMGTLQAVEALKILLGVGETLSGRLWVYDALYGQVRTLRWRPNPSCPVCGEDPTITKLIDYEQFCGLPPRADAINAAPPQAALAPYEISPAEASRLFHEGRVTWVDVRPAAELGAVGVPGAVHVEMDDLQDFAGQQDPAQAFVFYCTIGQRSAMAAEALSGAGLNARSVAGGLIAWQNIGLPGEGEAS